jgi:hypothetical protein
MTTDLHPEHDRYETKSASIGVPKAWIRDCIDKETHNHFRELEIRMREIEKNNRKTRLLINRMWTAFNELKRREKE